MTPGKGIMTSLTTFVCCLLLSTFLLVASQDLDEVGECTNKNDHCDGWAAGGQCEKNPIYMVANCRLACGKCQTDTESSSDNCRNTGVDEICEFWASRCECEKNPGYMYGNCRRACGGCDTDSESQTNSSTCRNKHIDGVCKFWADAGECEKNPGYMNANCRRACGKCDDDSLSESPAVNLTSPCAVYSTTPGNPLTTPEASESTTPVTTIPPDVSLTPSRGCRMEGEDIPVTLTCAATSDGPFTYTFFQDGTKVQSSASTTYTINSPQLSDAGTYTCKVVNSDVEVTSSDFYTLYILLPNDTKVTPAVPGRDQRYPPLCYQDTLYYIHEDIFSDLNTSLSKCQEGGPGAMMLEFNDRDEMNAISDYLDEYSDNQYDYYYIIGAYYDLTTEEWRLPSSGEVLPVTDWRSGGPDRGRYDDRNCVGLTMNWNMWTWYCVTDPPYDSVRFLCQI